MCEWIASVRRGLLLRWIRADGGTHEVRAVPYAGGNVGLHVRSEASDGPGTVVSMASGRGEASEREDGRGEGSLHVGKMIEAGADEPERKQ